MLAGLFLQGSLIGFSMAIPVGPVGMLCIQHSLRRGLAGGLIAGLGAALADALYGGMAGFGVSLLSHVMTSYQIWLQMFGALLLSILGIKIFKSQPTELETSKAAFSPSRIFFSTFALTLTNPLTLLCFAAVYASFGITPSDEDILPGIMLSLGVLLGAALWWMLLSITVAFIGKKYQIASIPLFNRISGGVLTGCGCLASLSVLREFLFI